MLDPEGGKVDLQPKTFVRVAALIGCTTCAVTRGTLSQYWYLPDISDTDHVVQRGWR